MRMLLAIVLIGLMQLPCQAEMPTDWAFQPRTQPSVPNVEHATQVRQPLDAFLLARLEAKKLRFSPDADRSTLIRRVTFDLTGLPPTPAEVTAFVDDPRPDAYDRVVDRLLASPHYGERSALFWLDLVRFAETDGFKADDPRPSAWRYRDYVIRAFNTDKPYNRFLQEQIAGDEIAPDDLDALIATGMQRHYPDEYNAINIEQRRQEILNDITDTVSSTFLGLTVGCARCHDHKFDPITQEDYFRIQAFFAAWWPVDGPLVTGSQRETYQQKLMEWESRTAQLREQLARIEAPYRAKDMAKIRRRFPDEYAALLDLPEAQRDPLQKQLALMVEKQVIHPTLSRDFTKQMKDAERSDWQQLQAQMTQLAKRPANPEAGMVFTDVGRVAPITYLLKRGDWKKHGDPVEPGYLSAIDDEYATVTPTPTTTGRRTALAMWLTKPDHPLTARVFVNRLWQQRFGRGLVGTPSDFGAVGDRPTHPELLDYLANDFVASGWSIKALDRRLITSTAYRQSSEWNESAGNIDPENHGLWHMNRRRLDGEALRDAMLSITGTLNATAGGPSVFPVVPKEMQSPDWKVSALPRDHQRRSIYVFVKRNLRYPLFALFDAPDRNEPCARRFVTTTAPQALTLLNDPLMLEMANSFADRVRQDVGDKPDAVISRIYELAFARPATSEERQALRLFLDKQTLVDLCHAVLNLNEFVTLD